MLLQLQQPDRHCMMLVPLQAEEPWLGASMRAAAVRRWNEVSRSRTSAQP